MTTLRQLLVDGFNIVHALDPFRSELRRDRSVVRDHLGDWIRVLHDSEDLTVTVVWDGRGKGVRVEHPHGPRGIRFVYTPSGMTADDLIEQWVVQNRHPELFYVASADRALVQTVTVQGAVAISPAALEEWVQGGSAAMAERLARLRDKNDQEWNRG